MKRSTFLQLGAGATALLSFPAIVQAAWRKVRDRSKGFAVASGKDRFDKPMHLMEGDTFYTKIATADTNGDVYVFESSRVKPGGPPLHVHPEQDEWWYVLQGEFQIKVGDELHTARTGDSVFGPRGVPHAFAKVGEGDARLLMIFQPAGKMEAYFKAVSEGATAKMTDEERTAFVKNYGFERVGPALDHLKQ